MLLDVSRNLINDDVHETFLFAAEVMSIGRDGGLFIKKFSPIPKSEVRGIHRVSHLSQIVSRAAAAAAAQSGLSPEVSGSSSTSCIPKSKSSSSTGPILGQSPIDYEIQQHPDKGNIHSLADIEDRLESINE